MPRFLRFFTIFFALALAPSLGKAQRPCIVILEQDILKSFEPKTSKVQTRIKIESDGEFFRVMELVKHKIPVNATEIQKVSADDTRLKDAQEDLGGAFSGRGLYEYGKKRIKVLKISWSEFLKLGGIISEEGLIKNDEMYFEILRALAVDGLELNAYIRHIKAGDIRLRAAAEIVGGPISGSTIYRYAEMRFGFKVALERAHIKTSPEPAAHEAMLTQVFIHLKKHIPLTNLAVRNIKKGDAISKSLVPIVGKEISGETIQRYTMSLRDDTYKTWEEVLSKLKVFQTQFSEEKDYYAALSLLKNKVSPSEIRFIKRGDRRLKPIKDLLHFDVDGLEIYNFGKSLDIGFRASLIKVGWELSRFEKDRFRFHEALDILVKTCDPEEIPFLKAKDPRMKSILRLFRRGLSGRSLFAFAQSIKGGWIKIWKDRGLDLNAKRYSQFKNDEEFRFVIESLNKNSVDLHENQLKNLPKGHPLLKPAEDIVGPISGAAIYAYGNLFPQRWYGTLQSFGLNIYPYIFWNKENIIAIFKEAHEKKLFFNAKALLENNSPEFVQIIQNHTGKINSSPLGLYLATIKYFGSVTKAVKAAGINYNYPIRKRSYGWINAQEEWVMDSDGVERKRLLLGEASKTPEELMEEKEQVDSLVDSLKLLQPRDRHIAQMMLKYLEENGDLSDKDDLVKFINQEINDAAKNDVDRLLSTLLEMMS